MKLVEVYPERQGRPFSPPAISLDRRGIGTPTETITATMLSTSAIDAIISYEGVVVCIEGDVVYKV